MANPWLEYLNISGHPKEVDDLFHIFDRANISSVVYWQWIFDRVKGLEFDSIVECGVGRGRSLLIIATVDELSGKLLNRKEHKIFGFDSFEGFPEPTAQDVSWRNVKKGEWSRSPSGKYAYSPGLILDIFKMAGVESTRLHLEKGFFNDSLKSKVFDLGKIGIVHIDADLYESVKVALDSLNRSIIPGGIIVIDDYIESESHNDAWPGCRKATEEFLKRHKNFKKEITPRGNVILIRDKF